MGDEKVQTTNTYVAVKTVVVSKSRVFGSSPKGSAIFKRNWAAAQGQIEQLPTNRCKRLGARSFPVPGPLTPLPVDRLLNCEGSEGQRIGVMCSGIPQVVQENGFGNAS